MNIAHFKQITPLVVQALFEAPRRLSKQLQSTLEAVDHAIDRI
jgi:hypothetical protein